MHQFLDDTLEGRLGKDLRADASTQERGKSSVPLVQMTLSTGR